MKKLIGFMCLLFALCLVVPVSIGRNSAEVKAKTPKWQKIYQAFINKDSFSYSKIGYAYIDNDSTPELLAGYGSEYASAIYTIKNNKVKAFSTAPLYDGDYNTGDITCWYYYWEKGNCLCDYVQDNIGTFYSIKNGKIIYNKIFENYDSDDGYVLRIDGEEVTESGYNEEFTRFVSDLNNQYGKKKRIKLKDYTKYHYDKKGSKRYEITDCEAAKISIIGNNLIVKGTIDSIGGNKHYFKLTSKTKYIHGDMTVSKKTFKKDIKGGFMWLMINMKKGKVYSLVTVG